MMENMDGHDDLAEFDTTEAEIDAMLAAGEPVEVTGPPLAGGAVLVKPASTFGAGHGTELPAPGLTSGRMTVLQRPSLAG